MMRKFLFASVATGLLFGSVAPAFAQSYAFATAQPPLGATATLNFKVPLGFARAKPKKASYGLTLSYGQRLDTLTSDGRFAVRQAKLADIRFAGKFKLSRAEVATFDLANLDKDPRLNMGPTDGKGKETTWLWVGGLVLVGVGVCALAGCFSGHHHHDDDELSSPQ